MAVNREGDMKRPEYRDGVWQRTAPANDGGAIELGFMDYRGRRVGINLTPENARELRDSLTARLEDPRGNGWDIISKEHYLMLKDAEDGCADLGPRDYGGMDDFENRYGLTEMKKFPDSIVDYEEACGYLGVKPNPGDANQSLRAGVGSSCLGGLFD